MLNETELETARKIVATGAAQIITRTWKVKAKEVLATMKGGNLPDMEDLDFVMTVVIGGQKIYVPTMEKEELHGATLVRDKVRQFIPVPA